MIYNESSKKVEEGHMKMPEIIIDSDNESTIKVYENEQYDNKYLEIRRNESNHLSCKSNLDDVDSGIHESNDIFLPGIPFTLHSNRLSLRDMKKRSNLSEIRSYSTNCLPIDYNKYKEGIGIVDPRLCRNCSTKTYSKKQSESRKSELSDTQFSIKDVIKKPEMKQKIINHEGFQHRLCRIRVLLICMKILLGSTMTGLGIYLFSISNSIKVKDCAFWASGPLLVSGLYEVVIFNWKKKFKRRRRICYLMTVICGILSFICSILCLSSSIYSGIHGNWISGHSENCYPEDKENEILDACCYTNVSASITLCHCQESRVNSLSPITTTMTYHGIKCRYLFSAVKDYLILQCALMGVGSGVCLWLLQMTMQRILNYKSIDGQTSHLRDTQEEQTAIEQSPVIPLKIHYIQSNERYQIFNEFNQENSVHNQNVNQLHSMIKSVK